MSLKYTLTENHLTSKKEDYTARTVDVKSNDINTIIDYMLQKGSTITKADILAVLNDFFEAIAHFTANGESINTDLIKTTLSISGVFDDVTDPFDKKKHHIKVNTNAGKVLKKALESIKVERVSVPDNNPHILEVKDSISSSINDKITSGGVVEIIGGILKIEGTDANNGVHFIASDGTKHKVVTLVENKPSKLIVIVPTLTAGTYTLEVTTQYNGSSLSKQAKMGTFSKALTVA